MTSRQERVQVLYEISLSIGRGDSLKQIARESLSAYLRKLNCTAGAILEATGDQLGENTYREIATIPESVSVNEPYRVALDYLDGRDEPVASDEFPLVLEVDGDAHAHLLELPGFGVLLLNKRGRPIDDQITAALGTLNQKLADACRNEQLEAEIRTERDRFQAVFRTIPEPVVEVDRGDGDVIIEHANPAFKDVFDYTAETAVGESLSELVVPADVREHETPVEQAATTARKQEVKRLVDSDPQPFVLHAVPLSQGADRMFFMYVDISDQRKRQRTLERLYRAAEDLLTASSVEEVCERAVAVAGELLDFSASVVHLYDRGSRALVPAATAGMEALLDDEMAAYTDRDSIVWDVYREQRSATISGSTVSEHLLNTERVQSAMVLPLSEHGVFVSYASEPDAFSESDQFFGRLLTTMVRTALTRVAREQALRGILETTRALVTAESSDAIGQQVVDTAVEVLELPLTGIWLYDPAEDALVPETQSTAAMELFDSPPTFCRGESIAWDVYETGCPRMIDRLNREEDAYKNDSLLNSELLVPLGSFGVILAGSTESRDFSQTEFELLQTLAAGVDSALRRLAQREELDILDQIIARVLRHNISNDLTAIIGRAEVIAQNGDGQSAVNAEHILSVSDKLVSTAEGAREMRRVVANRNKQVTVDIQAALQQAVTRVRDTYPDAVIEMTGDIERKLRAHTNFEYAVRQAIENGVQHSEASPARVEVAVEVRDGEFRIDVHDNGPGIPQAEIEPVQAGEETDLSHGTGVGLWIIDRVVRYSGGSVVFEQTGEGTTVSMRFDAATVGE